MLIGQSERSAVIKFGTAEDVVLALDEGKAAGIGCKPILAGITRPVTSLEILAI